LKGGKEKMSQKVERAKDIDDTKSLAYGTEIHIDRGCLNTMGYE